MEEKTGNAGESEEPVPENNKNIGGFHLSGSVIKSRSLKEISEEILKLARGILKKRFMDKCGSFLRAGPGVRILKKNASIIAGNKVELHRHVKLSAWGTEGRTEIVIGDDVSVGDRTEIHAGRKVEIGSGCKIAWDVCIMDRDYHKLNGISEDIKPVSIGNNVWIGCSSIILKGTKIGSGAVIAAGSVVTGDVPPGALAAGNPARVIREGVRWKP
ncbi:MAG: acyltransferase [Eubacteriales bacterium]|nr:acyltransferase [Eubacteriales bacterium]